MVERKLPPSLDDFDRRLATARQARETGERRNSSAVASHRLLGMAWRVAIELAVAVAVSAAVGVALDRWLGTAPWLMLLLLVMGMAAGGVNAMRAARQLRIDVTGPDASDRTENEKDHPGRP